MKFPETSPRSRGYRAWFSSFFLLFSLWFFPLSRGSAFPSLDAKYGPPVCLPFPSFICPLASALLFLFSSPPTIYQVAICGHNFGAEPCFLLAAQSPPPLRHLALSGVNRAVSPLRGKTMISLVSPLLFFHLPASFLLSLIQYSAHMFLSLQPRRRDAPILFSRCCPLILSQRQDCPFRPGRINLTMDRMSLRVPPNARLLNEGNVSP